jgi:DNA-directed RNA polymerase beta subunit
MTLPEVSEDGVIMSKSIADKMKFHTYETRFIEWGKNQFPLNIYGDDESYKIFPDIGEQVGEDDLLMVLRDIDPKMAIVDKNVYSTKVVDNIFDTKVHVVGGGTVIDVEVICNDDSQHRITELNQQLNKYIEGISVFHKKILEFHKGVLKKYGTEDLPYTPELWQLVRESLIATNVYGKEKIQKLYRKSQLDHYRVKIVVKREITPDKGFKITNLGGCKGVVCAIWDDDKMPVDADGNRADIIMDPKAYVNRMTMSGLIAHFLTATSRDIAKRVRANFGIERGISHYKAEKLITKAIETDSKSVQENWNYIMSYYQLASPIMYDHYSSFTITSPEVISNLATICRDMIYLYTPLEYSPDYSKVIPLINEKFKPLKGPVTITKENGERTLTKENVMIGSMYIILLEKIGDDLSAVSSAKLQHHGVLAQLGKLDKYSESIRNQPIKGLGEPDVRNFVAYCPMEFIAELMDRNNNPIVHKNIVRTILDAPKPTNIPKLVNRKELPFGSTKPIQFMDHLSQCSGWKFVYHSWKKSKK